jgi:hypothetical protein
MVRNLWLTGGLAVAGCAAQATPQPQQVHQNASVEASRAPTTAPVPATTEQDEGEVARQRIRSEAIARQTKQRERSASPRLRDEQETIHSREDWLKLARDVCHPIRCDGGPIDVNCAGGIPPEWARMQAGTEACAKRERQLEKEKCE